MRLHWLQHVPFEGLGHISAWAEGHQFDVSCTRMHEGESLPALDAFDLLVAMGGPMGIYDHDEFPWLLEEKRFIRSAIDADKPVLGICLGAQLIADVLGANVYPGPEKEIGWFPIKKAEGAPDWLPSETTVFHWHGDTFDIPQGANLLATSEAGINQGFTFNDGRVVALQFHLETTTDGMEALIGHCSHELVDAPYIQTAEQMRASASNVPEINRMLENMLDSLVRMRKDSAS